MKEKHIVIIGSGFGGVYTAQNLKPLIESGKVHVTIINRTNYFLFTPLLHEVATGGLSPTSVLEPIREIFRHSNVHFVQGEVKTIDTSTQEVGTATCSFPYDYLVVSSGADTNYYGIAGAEKNTFVLKNLEDAMALRRHFILSCEKGMLEQDQALGEKMLSTVIVGAGPTGVELASELVEFMEETLSSYYDKKGVTPRKAVVSLVAASPDVLPQFPPELRAIAQKELEKKGIKVMTGMKVIGVEPEKILFDGGTSIEAHTLIWVAGVKPVYIELAGTEKEKSGRIKIDEFLRVSGKENIFALGDASGTAPMLAQVAVQQGKTVAMNISASIENSPLTPFVFKEKGLLVSLGQWYAAGKIYGIVLKGPIMWWIWRTIYLFNFQSWRKRVKIATEWTVGLFYPRDITQI